MKKFFCAIMMAMFVTGAFAQDDDKQNVIVAYVGPQFSMATIGGGGFSTGAKFSFLGGLQYERNAVFGDDFGLYGGLEYSAKGVKDFMFLDGHMDNYNLNYLQLNLGAKYSKEIWGIDGFGEVGPYLAYGIGGESEWGIFGYKCDSFGDFDFGKCLGFKKFDFGFRIAVGAEFSGFRIMAGYQQGLINVADKKLISNGYKNYGFYAAVGYGFKF